MQKAKNPTKTQFSSKLKKRIRGKKSVCAPPLVGRLFGWGAGWGPSTAARGRPACARASACHPPAACWTCTARRPWPAGSGGGARGGVIRRRGGHNGGAMPLPSAFNRVESIFCAGAHCVCVRACVCTCARTRVCVVCVGGGLRVFFFENQPKIFWLNNS